ncbi:hypothetical protein EG328_000439 [Venturia inaequalis]|uniref:DUF3669 domain-containing protein n=1 Tax=Venturia inaequalis TaxID=5025 RepID=A0A8H3V2G8_VENIN|nr:hypothetical protein EG328_000439 [Venturia inaequalis]
MNTSSNNSKILLKKTLSTEHGSDECFDSLPNSHAVENGFVKYRCIGEGSCGTVFEAGTRAIKISPYEKSLWYDFHLTNRVSAALQKQNGLVRRLFPQYMVPRVPKVHAFMKANEDWSSHGCMINKARSFPSSAKAEGQTAIEEDLIQPLSLSTRVALIERYFDPAAISEALADPDNKDCLVRLYFGRRDPPGPGNWRTSLRNFELTLDIAEELELNVEQLTAEMAIGLAIIHWEAKVDAQDAEWVLGRPALEDSVQTSWEDFKDQGPTSIKPEHAHRSVSLWILDFDKSDTIDFDRFDRYDEEDGFAYESCIELLVRGVTSHDPYLPNPEVDRDLFEHFAAIYLRTSDSILRSNGYDSSILSLPGKFINAYRRWASTPDDAGFVFDGDDNQEVEGGWSDADVEEGCFSDDESEDSEESSEEELEVDDNASHGK